jgi:hypothetical protein
VHLPQATIFLLNPQNPLFSFSRNFWNGLHLFLLGLSGYGTSVFRRGHGHLWNL